MAKQAFIALLLLVAIWIAVSVKAEVATPRKLAENFQGQTVEELIKLPQGVVVPSGGTCYGPNFDQCDPGCTCLVPYIWPPPGRGICSCPKPQTHETASKMVGKFQDKTVVEKLINLPHKVMVPSGGKCYYPDYDQCDPGCVCIPNPRKPWPPPPGSCYCPMPPTLETARKMVGKFQDQTVTEKLIKLVVSAS